MGAQIGLVCVLSNPGSWGSGRVEWGGEVRALEVLKRFAQSGMEVWSLETLPSASLRRSAPYRVRTMKLPISRKGVFPALLNSSVLFTIFAVFGVSLRHLVKVILAPTSNLTDLGPAWVISRIARKPFVVIFQVVVETNSFAKKYRQMRKELGPLGSLIRTVAFIVALRLARSAAGILCISGPVLEKLEKLGYPSNKLFLTSMGVDFQAIENAVTLTKDVDGVFLGRIEFHKGIQDLIDAWKQVVQTHPEARLLVLGDGPFLGPAKQLVAKHNLTDNVEFRGYVSGLEKYSSLKRAKVFVFPSKSEGFGLVVAEAMACGVPIVCYDAVGRVFSNCKSVVSVKLGDSRSLGSVVAELLDDETRLGNLSSIAVIESRQFDWDRVAQIDLHVLQKVVAASCYRSQHRRQQGN